MTVQPTKEFTPATPVLVWDEYYAPERKITAKTADADAPSATNALDEMYEYYAA